MGETLDVLLRLILGDDSPTPVHNDGRINYDRWFIWAKEKLAADRLRAEAADIKHNQLQGVINLRGELLNDATLRLCEVQNKLETVEATLRSVAGSVGEFASADGKNIVEKIKFLRKDYEERLATVATQLCRVREAIKQMRSVNGTWCGAKQGWFLGTPSEAEKLPCRKCALCVADVALSESTPCPHEAEAKRLREAVESSQMEARGANLLVSSIEKLFPNWKSYRDLDDCIRCELAELRRRVAEGR